MTHSDGTTCLACALTAGDRPLVGGRIHETRHWVVEHCIGPLGVGALIVKPFRHCLHVGDLAREEAAELGPLLTRVSGVVETLCGADQVYVCLWSHMGFVPGHIHFVIQPARNEDGDRHARPGPFLQCDLFDAGELPEEEAVVAFCERARRALAAETD